MSYLISYLLLINAFAFLLMHMDKKKAHAHKWRVSEAALLSAAALGGSVGTLLGMYFFHHKTRHKKFTRGVPVILAMQLAAAFFAAKFLT